MTNDLDTFENKGVGIDPGKDHKKIVVHVICTCKHDGQQKVHLVAGGNSLIHLLTQSTGILRGGVRILMHLHC